MSKVFSIIRKLKNKVFSINTDQNGTKTNIFGIHFFHKSYALDSGERQIAISLNGIRKDHIFRYQLVIDFLRKIDAVSQKARILDCFSGNGYGTYFMYQTLNESFFGA